MRMVLRLILSIENKRALFNFNFSMFRCLARHASNKANLFQTALYQFSIDHGAEMTSFSGYSIPKQFKEGAEKEHLQCRSNCVLFDKSCMGQFIISGTDREEFFRNLAPLSFPYRPDNSIQHTILTNEEGGIDDDCFICSRIDNTLHVVVNGMNLEKDQNLFNEQLELFKMYEKNVDVKHLKNHSILSIQGPKSSEILNKICHKSITKLPYMASTTDKIDGADVWISRSGRTGEDGFDLSIEDPSKAVNIANILTSEYGVHPAGLLAANSLRIEAGIPLYGHELTETTTPVEARLESLVAHDRKEGFPPFCGGKKILAEIKDPKTAKDQRLVGISFDPKIEHLDVQKGAKIYNSTAKKIVGEITSAVWSPVLKKMIGMGYVNTFLAGGKKPAPILVECGGQKYSAFVSEVPFITTHYYRG